MISRRKIMSKVIARAQLRQNMYFKEYMQVVSEGTCQEVIRRQGITATRCKQLSLVDQATYADYVTRKMCVLAPRDELSTMIVLLSERHVFNVVAIGNMALLLLTLRDEALIKQWNDTIVAKQKSRVNYCTMC